MLQNGVDVKAVQEVLGHEHLNTTEIYTHIDNEALRVAAKANPLSRVKPPKKNEAGPETETECSVSVNHPCRYTPPMCRKRARTNS